MAGVVPEYRPVADDLPPVYAEDAASFAQVESFLSLADDLNRAYVARLDELTTWLSPDALGSWPADRGPDAGGDAVLARYLAVYDELARWLAFRFPPSWGSEPASLDKRRSFLARAAQLWRRRGTPQGFVGWFCFWFDVPAEGRPTLVEHFKYGVPTGTKGDDGPAPWLRATLFVPATDRFDGFERRREAIAFVERFAPAHVLMRVCWVKPTWALPDQPPMDASEDDIGRYRTAVRQLLCGLVSFTDHEHGIRIWECIDQGRPGDRLDVGQLPGGG